MRHRNHRASVDTAAVASLQRLHATYRTRVDAEHEHMRTVLARTHRPEEARAAAHHLSAALGDATRSATQILQVLKAVAPPPRHQRHVRMTPDPSIEHWSAELLRVTEIDVWLRRSTLDDPGVHLPMAPRIGSYAAKGPHIAGLDFGHSDPLDLREQAIGVVMRGVIDGRHGEDERRGEREAVLTR